MAVRHRNNRHLNRRQPDGESTGIMLDKQPEEALPGPQQGTVHHVGAVLQPIRPDIDHVEPFREVEVELDGCHLPLAAQGISYLEVNLGAVESAAAFVNSKGQPLRLDYLPQCFRCLLPLLFGTDGLGRAGRQINPVVTESKSPPHM